MVGYPTSCRSMLCGAPFLTLSLPSIINPKNEVYADDTTDIINGSG